MDSAQFLQAMSEKYGKFDLLWVIEDACAEFRAGRGQIALVGIKTDGWQYEPNVVFFPWASKRNILRANVAFFHMVTHSKAIGLCVVKCGNAHQNLFNHAKQYVGMFYNKIPHGYPNGPQHVYTIRGKRHG
jgi:hypothetical protein